jgi:hypothetical protein
MLLLRQRVRDIVRNRKTVSYRRKWVTFKFTVALNCHAVKDIFESYLKNLFTFRMPREPPSDEEEEDDGKTEEERIQEAKELIASFFSSNIKDEEEKKEIFDSEEELTEKLDRVAGWMRESKHVIMFTGAGISTRLGPHPPLSKATPSFSTSIAPSHSPQP